MKPKKKMTRAETNIARRAGVDPKIYAAAKARGSLLSQIEAKGAASPMKAEQPLSIEKLLALTGKKAKKKRAEDEEADDDATEDAGDDLGDEDAGVGDDDSDDDAFSEPEDVEDGSDDDDDDDDEDEDSGSDDGEDEGAEDERKAKRRAKALQDFVASKLKAGVDFAKVKAEASKHGWAPADVMQAYRVISATRIAIHRERERLFDARHATRRKAG
jgi:hypothetical protein